VPVMAWQSAWCCLFIITTSEAQRGNRKSTLLPNHVSAEANPELPGSIPLGGQDA